MRRVALRVRLISTGVWGRIARVRERMRGALGRGLGGLLLGLAGLAVAAGPGEGGGAAAAARAAPAPPPYALVLPGRTLAFPADHGAHPDYRTEWWYITGWVRDAAGVERGFQLTFFRVRTLIGEDNPSAFAPRQLILAHAAVADPATGRLRHAERSARAYPGLVEARTDTTQVVLDDWFLTLQGAGSYHSRIEADEFGFDLQFDTDQPPLLQGVDGFSQKAPDPRHASYYYSRPQLRVSGSLRVGSQTVAVSGHAWLDHEWSSEILPAGARGWDWIGINLHDGGALMAFQMRDEAGGALYTTGVQAFTPLRRWRSPRTGVGYPVEWLLTTHDGRRLHLRALMDDQELDSRRSTGAIYWEGAVRLFEPGADGNEREIGQGYLEMTGYAERLRL